MKRLGILAVVALIASLLGVVGGARPAAADSNGKVSIFFGVDVNGATYGSPVAFSAKVSDASESCLHASDCDTPTGRVDFYAVAGTTETFLESLDLEPGHSFLCSSGSCAQTINPATNDDSISHCCLDPGTYTFRAKYEPGNFDFSQEDYKFAGNSSPAQFTFTKADTSTSVTQSSSSTVYGQEVSFSIHVAGASDPNAIKPKGSVDIVEGPAGSSTTYGTGILDGGDTVVKTTQLPPGPHSLRDVYAGDNIRYNGSSTDVSHTVTKGNTSSSLATSAASTTFGQEVTLTDTVSAVSPASGTPTGTVTFSDQTVGGSVGTKSLDSSGAAALKTSSLAAGPHSIRASYPGDTNFAGGTSNTVSVSVAKVHTTTTLTTSAASVPFGNPVTFTATVLGDYNTTPTGTVQFKDGAANLGTPQPLYSGSGYLTLSTLGGGMHSITAVYSGDANHNASTSSPLTETITCDRVVTGSQSSLTASGTTCVSNARISGTVTVPAGAKLSIVNSTVAGSILVRSGAGPITVCGSSAGSVSITGASGFILLGDPYEDGCAGNTFTSSVMLTSNTGGLELGANHINSSVTVKDNVGSGPAPNHTSPEVQANTIYGSLTCTGNSPVVSNDRHPNTVTGYRGGECAGSSF